jgi:Integrase core domain/Integrase zinc binding domain
MAQKVAIADYNHRKLSIGNGDKKTSNAEEPPVKVGTRGVRMVGDSMWVPAKAVDLQLSLCVEAHCGAGGHRGYKETLIAIKEYVTWVDMEKDVKVFVQNRMHCVSSASGEKISRPLGTQIHATRPNKIMHFDLLYMGQSKRNKYKYLLLLKDDLSGYLWLVPCKAAGAAETVDALIHCFATFGVVLQWFSDQGAHFKNQIMLCLQKKLKSKHHFTSAHCPWANGTIESACKQVIRVSRALLSDPKISMDDWDKVVPVIQSVLNNSPASRLQNRTPMYVFTSHKDTTPHALILKGEEEVEIASIDFIKAQKLMEMEKTAKIMAEIHTHVVA